MKYILFTVIHITIYKCTVLIALQLANIKISIVNSEHVLVICDIKPRSTDKYVYY
jgi:hypothetical protein